MARNKYPEETKNKIIKTAGILFCEKGYEHTSIQDIIDHLGGLSKGAIYHHFHSKEEIMWAVADQIYSGSGYQVREIADRTDLNGKEKLKMIFLKSINSEEQVSMFTVGHNIMKNPQFLMMFLQRSVQQEAPDLVRPIIEEGIADGSIQTEYPKELAEVVMLVSNVWINPMIYECDTPELIQRLKFFQLMLRQMGLDVIEDSMFERIEKLSDFYHKNKKEREQL